MINVNILKSNLEVVLFVVDYFATEFNNKEGFEKVKKNAIKWSNKFNSPNGEKLINLGFLSPLECTMYLSDNGVSNTGRVIDETIKALEEKLIIYPIDKMLINSMTDLRYRMNGEYAMNWYRRKLILNILLGFEYIIEVYGSSVVKIEHISENEDHSIGTGFLISHQGDQLIITNKHVIENHSKLNIYDNHDNPLDFDIPFLDPKKDIAVIPLKQNIVSNPFQLNDNIKILDEIITIGYPSIPMTNLAYQVYHKGEINSFVEDYYQNKLFLISAKTSAGNSGSPVIDGNGTVVGIVTEELFEKEQFYEKGKLPYYAAITAKDILNTIESYKNRG